MPICATVEDGGEAALTYIERLNAFYAYLKRQPLSPYAKLLYYTLLQIDNERGWAPWFAVTNAHLCMFIGIGEKTLIRARRELAEQGLIGVQPSRTRGVATRYTLLPPPAGALDNPTDDSPTNPPTAVQTTDLLEKEPREKKQINACTKTAYAPHVHLTAEEHAALCRRYGVPMTERMIATLEDYKRTSGRRYNSDYEAMERWVAARCARAPAQTRPAPAYAQRTQTEQAEQEDVRWL